MKAEEWAKGKILAKYLNILYINYSQKLERLYPCTSCVRTIYHKMELGQNALDNKINFSHTIFVCKFYFACCLLQILRHFWNNTVNIREMLWEWTYYLFLAISSNNSNVYLLTESNVLKRIYFINLKNIVRKQIV